MTSYLMIIYFCLLSDTVCDGNTQNSSSFYVKSCDEDYVSEVLKKVDKKHNSPPKYRLEKYECFTVNNDKDNPSAVKVR